MNDDIVARLRVFTKTLLLGDFQGLAATTESAADEIERLRKYIDELEDRLFKGGGAWENHCGTNDD